jgi:ribosomal protein S18 acetylase RimI-like enzyme
MAGLNVEAGRAAWADFLPVERMEPRVAWYAENLPSALAAFVAEEDGRVVGFVVARHGGVLDTLYTAPRVWGRGVGRALMDAALGALRDVGYEVAVLWTAEQNTRAREIYERYGWKLDGATTEKTFVGVTFTELRYKIEL